MASSTCIYYVASANISVDGLGFTLYKLTWVTTPPATQSVLVQYRKQGDVTWINVSTNLQVDIYGNITSPLTILTPAEAATYYEIRFVNQCGSLEYIQTFFYSAQLNAGTYLVDFGLYNICGNDSITLFSDIPFDVGAIMYTDTGLTDLAAGHLYIANNDGIIYAIDPVTAVVGADTGYSCNDSFETLCRLAASAGASCSATIVPLYSDEVPTIGTILYTDKALSIAATGSAYVNVINQGIIYNVNSGTGAITSIDGTSCTSNGGLYQYAPVFNDVFSADGLQLFTPGSFGRGAIMYTDYAMTTELTGQNFIAENESDIIYSISSTTGEVGCIAVEC
jgi:hypothetical protein